MKKGLRKAVIDCGTNTFHLLIVVFDNEKDFTILHKEKVAVKIGVGGIQKNMITENAALRATKTLSTFSSTMKEFNVEEYLATATSAFRNAHNAQEIAEKIKSETGIGLNIINGADEANLIYKGVSNAVKLDKNYGLIMDIGGGSVEFILCNNKGVKWLKSFEIGGIRLYEKFHKHDPISTDDVTNLDEYLNSQLQELYDVCNEFQPKLLLGASGSFDTLSEIYAQEKHLSFDEDTNLSFDLPIENTLNIIDKLVLLPREQRINIKGMIPLRVDLIVVAGLLVKNILENINFEGIETTGYALKEGLLYTSSLQEQ